MTWDNAKRNCMLCRMDKRTKWYYEDEDWVVAEKLGGGPFVVVKDHKDELSEDEWSEMEQVVSQQFDDFSVEVRMGLVPNHWHGHVVTDDDVDLSGE